MAQSKLPWFVPTEVAQHDSREDCWVSIFDRVLDITPLIAENHGELAQPLLNAAGQDISHWFTRTADGLPDIRSLVDPATNVTMPYCPAGRFIHVPVTSPTTTESNDYVDNGGVWWRNRSYEVGRLSARPRRMRLINTLTSHDHDMTLAAECTISDIQAKYLGHNAHGGAYTWKGLVRGEFRPLDMGATLAGNAVDGAAEGTKLDRDGLPVPVDGGHDDLLRLGMDPDEVDNLPVLMLYFNDDLTVA